MNFRSVAMLLALTSASAAHLQAQDQTPPVVPPGITTPTPADAPAPAAAPAPPVASVPVALMAFYGDVNADLQRYNNIYVVPTNGQGTQNSAWVYGPTVGFFVDFTHIHPIPYVSKYTDYVTKHTGRFRLGLDLREEIVRAPYYVRNSTLGGVRISTAVGRMRPYVEGAGGYARTKQPFGANYMNYKNGEEWAVFAGIDYKLKHHIDWRVVEVGGGSLLNYQYTPTPGASNSIFNLATGFVFLIN